jgi:hypothetical protein
MSKQINKLCDDIADAIHKAVSDTADIPPKGYLTREQLSACWKLKKTSTIEKLRAGLKLKVIDKKMFRIVSNDKTRIIPTPHYRIIKK